MKTAKKFLVLILALSAIFALASCAEDAPEGLWADALYTEDTTLGNGAKTVFVEVIAEDKSVTFTVKTDAELLGDALVSEGLIEGTPGPYGLYIDKVNGILASWDADCAYWGLSIGGEYAMSGVDTTPIEAGAHYELTYTK